MEQIRGIKTMLQLIFVVFNINICLCQTDYRNDMMNEFVISNISSKLLYENINVCTKKNTKVIRWDLKDYFLNEKTFYLVKYLDLGTSIDNYKLYQFYGMQYTYTHVEDSLALRLGDSIQFSELSFGRGLSSGKGRYPNLFNYFDDGIIGVHEITGEIIAISGVMFLDDIKKIYFKQEGFNKDKKKEYVNLRYYNYHPNITVVKKNKIYFISEITNKLFEVKIKKRLFNNGYNEKIKVKG